MRDEVRVIAEFLAETKDKVRTAGLAYRLLKDGNVWDYSTHPADVVRWWNKVRAEEGDEPRLEIEFATYEEMVRWKEGM